MSVICIFIQIIQYGLHRKIYLYFISELSGFMGIEQPLISSFFNSVISFTLFKFLITNLIRR